MEKEKGGFSPWRKCTQALLDLKWYLPQPLFFVKITTSETEILLKERSYYQQQSHFTAMWLTAGHMVPRSPLVDSSIILTREEERLSLPSSLPSPPPSLCSFFFLPLSPFRRLLRGRHLKLTLEENPTGTWRSLIKSKCAAPVQADAKRGSRVSAISPFHNKTSHLGQGTYHLHHSHTSITSLSRVSAPVLGLEYLQPICLSQTHFSLKREINLSFSPLSAFSLLLPPPSPALAICHEQLPFSHLKFSMTLKIDCTHTPGHGER